MLPAEHTRILVHVILVYLRVRGRLKTPDNQVRCESSRSTLPSPSAPPGESHDHMKSGLWSRDTRFETSRLFPFSFRAPLNATWRT